MAATEALISLRVLSEGTWTFGGTVRKALYGGTEDLMEPNPHPQIVRP